MSSVEVSNTKGLAKAGIEKLEKLKSELEALQRAVENLAGKSSYEVEGRIRAFQDKEHEIKRYLRELGMLN